MGSTADRLSQFSSTAVLVVRDPRPLERWALEDRPLQAVLALDAGRPSEAAVRSTGALREQGPCDVVEVHVYDPLHEARRLGLSASEGAEAKSAIENALARELPGRLGELRGRGDVRFVALPARGPTAEALAEFVDGERADLLIIGAHGWSGLHRRTLGSVSFGVLPLVDTNVLIVHAPRAERLRAREPAAVRRALVATDLSEVGNRALDYALAVVPQGSQLILLHVLTAPETPAVVVQRYPPVYPPAPEERRLTRALAEGELKKLLPDGRALECEVEVVESQDVSRAILQAAERHDVDLLCLGTHGRGRLASALLGSVARIVTRRSPRPVLLVPPAES